MHDKRTENPYRLERRALWGAITHHFNLEQGLPGGVDAKSSASSKILFNLQIILEEEKKPLFVPDDSLLNKALTSTILYLCSFIQFDSGYSGLIQPSSKFRDTQPQGLVLGGPISLATFRSKHGSLVPTPQASRLLKGAGSGRGVQQTAGTSDKVTIEQPD